MGLLIREYGNRGVDTMKKIKLQKKHSQILRVMFGRGIVSKICFGVIVFFLFLAVFAPVLTPYSPTALELDNILSGPTSAH